jgi:hypothetical protein
VEIIVIMGVPDGFIDHFKEGRCRETLEMILEDSDDFKPYNNVTKQICKQNDVILNNLKQDTQKDALGNTLQYLLEFKNPETIGLALSLLKDKFKKDPRVELILDGMQILMAYMTQGI